MLNILKKPQLPVIFILAFLLIFSFLYITTKSYGTITFDINIIHSKSSKLSGQIYYAKNHDYTKLTPTPFLLRNNTFNTYKTISVPIYDKHITSIRLDPLNHAGEVIIKNFTITEGSWFNIKHQPIDLSQINVNIMNNIEVLSKGKNLLHLRALGVDPYVEIVSKLDPISDITNYKTIILSLFFSSIIMIFFLLIFKGLKNHYLRGEELLTALIIIIYSVYSYFFAIHHSIVQNYLMIVPLLLPLIIYLQGFKSYLTSLKIILISLISLTLLTLLIDYVQDTNRFTRYKSDFLNIISAMLIVLIFIQKKNFNYHFYKNFFFIFTLLSGIVLSIVHLDIIQIDTITIEGYRVSIGPWAQKSHAFLYLLFMWAAISFFHFSLKNKKDFFSILILIFISSLAIFTGYSSSAKLAFAASLIVYFIFSWSHLQITVLKMIPILISLYVLFTPWISNLFSILSSMYERLAYREPIFTVYSNLIKENLFFGYGFNSCIALTPSDYLDTAILEQYADSKYIDICSPHTLPLLLWLNFGLAGVILISLLIYLGVKKVIKVTYLQTNQAALIALISAFIVITTFSWGSWYPHTLTYYALFLGLILLSLNQNISDKADAR